MKKILKILTTIAVVLAAALFFAGCKQFLEDPEEFLGYWSSEVVPIDFSINKPYQMSNDGALCIPSADDVKLTIKLRNPRKFTLIMPTSVFDAGKVINFPGFPSDHQPRYGTDYTFKQTGDMLELTYRDTFLKAHEWSNGAIGPEITLISTDGRKFNKKFSINLKADTAPSLEYKGVGKSSDNKYVLIFQAKNMGDEATSGHYVHEDIKKLHITTEGGGSSDYTVTGIDFTAKKINWGSGSPFLANATQLAVGEYDGAPPPFPASTDKWLIYFKTDVAVSSSSALKTYRVRLSDGAGLVSNEVQGSTCMRKIGEIQVQSTPPVPIGSGTGSDINPYKISCDGDGVKLEVWCQTPADSVKIRYWVTNLGADISSSGEGTASPTNHLKTIRLPAPTDIGTKIKYEVQFKAVKPGFADNEKTVYYELMRKLGPIIDGNEPNAWAKLKYAIKYENEPEIIIKNEIKAKGGSIIIGGQTINNDEQINVGRNVKIKGFNTDAVINADSKCRIFSVTSGTLKLNDLKLKNGKAKAGANGGSVYVSNGGTAELSGCAIENCTADLGGGIGASGHVKLTNTSIKTCEATSTTKGGGAVYAKGCTIELTGCTLKGNTARYSGGAIYAEKKDSTPSTVTISGGTIGGTDTNKNIAQNDGGGIWVGESCTLTMKDYAKVIGNKARNGSGGGIYAEGAIVNITNCTFKGNETDMNTHNRIGGAIYAKKTDSSSNKPSTITISGGTIGGTDANDANKATSGGGIWVGKDCTLTMKDNAKVIGNHSNFSGGGVYAEGATVNITNCTFKGNSVSGSGGAIYADKKNNKPSTVTISGGAIGGTGTNDGNKTTSDGGGGIYVGIGCELTLKDNVQVIGNTSSTDKCGGGGGGIYAYGATVKITNCTLKGNTAMRGGAIFANKPNGSSDKAKVTVSGNTTIGGTDANDANKATGNGYYESGGGIWVGPECELTLEDNVQVINNWAKKNGSGVYVQNASTKFTMKGSAKIDTNNNDVYLEEYDGGAMITVGSTLTPSGGTAARITVPNNSYHVGTQVLTGSYVYSQYTKFKVTRGGTPPQDWAVDNTGKLKPR